MERKKMHIYFFNKFQFLDIEESVLPTKKYEAKLIFNQTLCI